MNGFEALPELMTMDQLAERLGVTHRHVRRLVDERRVPFLRVGRFIRFDPAEISAWLDRTRVTASRPAVGLAGRHAAGGAPITVRRSSHAA